MFTLIIRYALIEDIKIDCALYNCLNNHLLEYD